MNAGELDKLITIQRVSQVTQPNHSHLDVWSDLADAWCQIKVKSMVENDQGQAQQYDVLEVKLWPTDVTHKDRFTYDGDIYDIQAVDSTRTDFYIIKAVRNEQGS